MVDLNSLYFLWSEPVLFLKSRLITTTTTSWRKTDHNGWSRVWGCAWIHKLKPVCRNTQYFIWEKCQRSFDSASVRYWSSFITSPTAPSVSPTAGIRSHYQVSHMYTRQMIFSQCWVCRKFHFFFIHFDALFVLPFGCIKFFLKIFLNNIFMFEYKII